MEDINLQVGWVFPKQEAAHPHANIIIIRVDTSLFHLKNERVGPYQSDTNCEIAEPH